MLRIMLAALPWCFVILGLPCGMGWPSLVFRFMCALFSYCCFMSGFLPSCKQFALHSAMIFKSTASALVSLTWCQSDVGWYVFLAVDALFAVVVTSLFGFSRCSKFAHLSVGMLLSVEVSIGIVTEGKNWSFQKASTLRTSNWLQSLFWAYAIVILATLVLIYRDRLSRHMKRVCESDQSTSSRTDVKKVSPCFSDILPMGAAESPRSEQNIYGIDLGTPNS
eukprot:TRINITY_DN76777_c0_g1_i1.p1 TRINITY_DN76777_c0_g1~~TRINITY_DN76777_c0_g1_i1.p1  ORF type:complete len:222 (+),score=8.48 TRINITY_DN76777_c0_g1_i1:1-666(+)